jgi:6-bladed beta-propeller
MKKLFIVILFINPILYLSCYRSNSKLQSNRNDIIIESDKDKELFISSFCSNVTYLKLESTSNNVLGAIDKAIFLNNRIYIFDSKTMKIAVFDMLGKFIFQTNSIGRGPKEYLNISDFLVDSLTNYLEIWDTGNHKIITLDEKGRFVKEKSFPLYVENFYKFSNGDYVFYAWNYLNEIYFKKNSYNIILTNPDFQIKGGYLPIRTRGYLKFKLQNCFVKYEDGVNFAIPFDNHLYCVSKSGCYSKYNIVFVNYSLPDDILKSYSKIDENNKEDRSNAMQDLLLKINSNSYAMGIKNIFENQNIVFFQYYVTRVGTFTVVYNKLTKHTYIGIPNNDLDYGLFGNPIAVKNDTLITYIFPYDLFERISSLISSNSINTNNIKFLKLKNIAHSLKELDNPLLLKYSLKDF